MEPSISIDTAGRMIHYEVEGVGLILYSPDDARKLAAKLVGAADYLDGQVAR
jgi:hypothetical protein